MAYDVQYTDDEGGYELFVAHERIIMPLIAMGISLVLVAFVPLLFYA